ncbi:MAG TPA: M23 family metallopeptidase [Acidimicrobiales bacterium]|nr:M23 family metallopeptidase [Acidimicrobiales bacterium]
MHRRLSISFIATTILLGLTALVGTSPATADEPAYRRIHFPVEGSVSFRDDFGEPRSGGRTHQGNDLMGTKLQKLLAAADGTVTMAKVESGSGLSGNMLAIRDADGWQYWYIHINNDSPGTDDALNPPEWRFAPGIAVGSKVKAGQHVAFLGDSGNAESTGPHLHFELHQPDGTAVDPWTSLRLAQGLPAGTRCGYDENPRSTASNASGSGYWVLGSDGGVFSFGNAPFYGSTGGMRLNQPIVGMAATKTGKGYWLVARDGGIFAYGDAAFYGSTGAIKLNKPIVGMAPTPSGLGYWLVASDGGIFAYGDAPFYGSTGAIKLNKPVNGMAPTKSGDGYWLIGSDGGLFAYGDAAFQGSVPGLGINTTVVSMAPTKSGKGYWMLGQDGGVFGFGDAGFKGSLPASGLCQWPNGVRIRPTFSGAGYWVQGADGSTWAFGDAKDYGAVNRLNLGAIGTIDMVPAPLP